jgi:NDP-sugar pyrophosphorylase family protein
LVVAETDHPYDSDQVRVQDNLIKGFFRARAGEPCEPFAAAAVWIVTSALMDLVPTDKRSDFGRDIFPAALQKGLSLAGFKTTDLIADLGTPERLAAFEKRRQGPKK